MGFQVSGLKITFTRFLPLLIFIIIIFQIAIVDATSNSGATILGDINGPQGVPDSRIDFEDIIRFVELYQTQIYQPLIDLNRDLSVDSNDVLFLIDAYNNFYSNAFTEVEVTINNPTPISSTYTYQIIISGSYYIVRNSAGATILTSTDFGALFNSLNTQLVSGNTVRIVDGTYQVKSTASLTKTNIIVTGSSGTILQHAVGLGDYPMLSIQGSGNTVQGITFDDAYFCKSGTWADYSLNKNIGTNGCVVVGGTDNTLNQCKLNRASRYGLLLSQSTRGKIINCETTESQYGISGTSGSGNAYWAVDGLISGNKIAGYRLYGIKCKSFNGVVIENNQIDCRAYLPSQLNNPIGVEFSSDAPNMNVIVRNNDIYMSGTDIMSYQFGVWTTTLPLYALPNTVQTGNQIINNRISNVKYGVYIQMDNFLVSGNTMTSVQVPYTDYGQNNVFKSTNIH